MASIERNEIGVFFVRFRYGGTYPKRSLFTCDAVEALAVKQTVEATLRKLRLGQIAIPSSVDPILFILGGGAISDGLELDGVSIADAVEIYFSELPLGAKEKNSVNTERTHLRNFCKIIGGEKLLTEVVSGDLQRYVSVRSKDKGQRGRLIAGTTIKKETVTIRAFWAWVRRRYTLTADFSEKLVLPKARYQQRFQTTSQIMAIINRGGLTKEQELELWECLYLNEAEVLDVLERVRNHTKERWLYPAVAIAAFTGARRSEIVCSQIEDVDFPNNRIALREKKRVRNVEFSMRIVDMHHRLREILAAWLQDHPGGLYLIAKDDGRSVSVNVARWRFERTLENSQWDVVKGWHVLRHSFASICAARGVPPAVIDSWMGHQTLAMRERYRHLFPETTASEMARMFGRVDDTMQNKPNNSPPTENDNGINGS
jgi:integrase